MTHVDFSCDGQYLQCDSQKGGELLFFDTERYGTRFGLACAVLIDKSRLWRVGGILEVARMHDIVEHLSAVNHEHYPVATN